MAADHHVAEDVETPDRAGGLEDGAEPRLGGIGERSSCHGRPVDQDLATVESEEAGDATEQRRLAGPFGPIKQVSEPGSTRTLTSLTAATAPKDLPAPRASHAAPVLASVIQWAPY